MKSDKVELTRPSVAIRPLKPSVRSKTDNSRSDFLVIDAIYHFLALARIEDGRLPREQVRGEPPLKIRNQYF
jgi:hypothetical protein